MQRHTCLVGGSRSGKTTLFVTSILVRAMRAAGSRHVILREHTNAARSSIALDTLPKALKLRFPGVEMQEHRQDGYFSLPNESEIWVGGLDDPQRVDKILGKEYATIFFNECSQIAYGSVLVALTRLAQVVTITGRTERLTQRAYYDLNPVGKGHWSNVEFGDKRDPITREPLAYPDDYRRAFINPIQNEANLTPEYLQSLRIMPERSRRRFYEGVYVDEVEGALWTYETLEHCRVEEFPEDRRRRVVVAVDPSGAASAEDESKDEIGIVVVALGDNGHTYVLADRSLRDSPAAWAKVVVTAYHEFNADLIVAEQNFGGEMVRSTIRAADPMVPVRVVTASRGKVVRAEPVSALYESGLSHHVGRFPMLEDQMCAYSTAGYLGEGSPDHADALVWAITELVLSSNADAWISLYAKLAEHAQEVEAEKNSVHRPRRGRVEDDVDLEDAAEINNVTKAYNRILTKTGKQTIICPYCTEEVTDKTRITDGEHVYHEDCYHLYLKRGNKVAVR